MNKQGLLIYNREDYEKNKWFASELIKQAKSLNLDLLLILRQNLLLTIENNQFLAYQVTPSSEVSPNFQYADFREVSPISISQRSDLREVSPTSQHSDLRGLSPTSQRSDLRELSPTSQHSDFREVSPTSQHSDLQELSLTSQRSDLREVSPDFVINRTRDALIGRHFENMGCLVFNSSYVTDICNHKGKTHEVVNHNQIPCVKTLLGHSDYFDVTPIPFSYPMVLKTVGGHGGNEVFRVNHMEELRQELAHLKHQDFILQEFCSNPGTDIRVFVLGKNILAAVKRTSSDSFKSNYSLGGHAAAYALTTEEEALVHRIIDLFDFDLVGIDFILNKEGQFLFNEIEDVVGTRTLYLNYNLDVIQLFLQHILQKL